MGDEDLLLNVMAESLLDKPASDKVIEDASELLGRILFTPTPSTL